VVVVVRGPATTEFHLPGLIPGAEYLSRYVTSRPGQLSLAILSRVCNEYQLKGGDA